MKRRDLLWRPLLLLLSLVGAQAVGAAETGAQAVDYNRDVRPILSKSCYACHGPDPDTREVGLRLDLRASALAKAESDAIPIVPGDKSKSALYQRIVTEDESERMPPLDSGHALEADQIATLGRWIDQGAGYAEHWSFVAPHRGAPPAVETDAWARNSIDRFVLAELERHGLKPAPEADRHVLLRRLSLDLRGLPPTLDEMREFLDDSSEDAYEKAVDRMLDDPAYGERWARMWIDLARYADSKGYGSDPLREIWRYRDWLVDALNANLPYDEFTIEQLAGDLLPKPTVEQRIATAFHRNTMTNTEGGTDDEEFRDAAVKDRVDTTMQVWMGLTMGCAKCHSHKYDPIAQREYYEFYAFFNQTADADRPDDSPTLTVPTALMVERNERIDSRIAALRPTLETPTPSLGGEQKQWEAGLRSLAEWSTLEPVETTAESGAKLRTLNDGSILVEPTGAANDLYTVTTRTKTPGITAFRLEAIPDPILPGGGPGLGKGGEFVLSRFTISAEPAGGSTEETSKPITIAKAAADYSRDGFPVADSLKQKEISKGGWAIHPRHENRQAAIYVVESPVGTADGSVFTFRLDQRFKEPNHTLGRFRISATTDLNVSRRAQVPADVLAIADKPDGQRSDAQRAKLAAHHRSIAPSLQTIRDRIANLEKSRPKYPTVPVMQELTGDKRRHSHVLIKGNFLSKGDEVTPGLPAAFHPPSGSAPTSRLDVARWLVDRNNPLTARVAVNRLWAKIFGVGIVETEEDFGTQGEPPSHPRLLDWLATEFMRRDWDNKALLRLIVTSATYRQTARVEPDVLKADPRNRLLTRGPRFRLDAELVRDQAMALSGLLCRKIGGASVYPPQPPGLWRAAFNGRDRQWATSIGEDRYRRGLYTFWRRTVPYPSMATFDAPSREVCSIRRIRTNTPLQAFVTMNDPVYVEASQALARRIVREGGATAHERAAYALRHCLARPPHKRQVEQITKLFQAELEHFRTDPKGAERIATAPIGPAPAGMDTTELAAWTVVANVLLNLDGVLMKG